MESEGFSLLDSAGDARLRLRAADLAGLFRAGLSGVTALVTDPATVESRDRVRVTLEAPDREELLVAWLNELIFLLDTREFLPAGADITALSETRIEATIHGEPMVRGKHERRLLVKAATYHGLFIGESENGYAAEVTLDL